MAVLLGVDPQGWSGGAAPVQIGGINPGTAWGFGSLGLPTSTPQYGLKPPITYKPTKPRGASAIRREISALNLDLSPGIGEGPKVPKPPHPKNLGFLLLLIIILPGLFGK
jgi:hypothetical protein